MGFNKDSICWDCANFSKCTWSRGSAIDGWTAKKTVIRENKQYEIRSYIVKKCPQFKQDKLCRYTCREIADIIGESPTTTASWVRKGSHQLIERLAEKGFKLRRFDGDCGYYLEKVE